MLLHDLQRTHRFVARAKPAVALDRVIDHQDKAGARQRQVHRSLPGLAIDAHRLPALAALRFAPLIPAQFHLRPLPVGADLFHTVALGLVQSSDFDFSHLHSSPAESYPFQLKVPTPL